VCEEGRGARKSVDREVKVTHGEGGGREAREGGEGDGGEG